MSRKTAPPSIERRVRRIATRLNLHLMIAQKPDKQVLSHGGYMLRDSDTMAIIFGDKDYPFSADIYEVLDFLVEREARPT